MIFLYVFLWWLLGVLGFIYWWTSEYDLELVDAVFSVFVGMLGPLSFIIGFFIHSPSINKVIIPRRKF